MSLVVNDSCVESLSPFRPSTMTGSSGKPSRCWSSVFSKKGPSSRTARRRQGLPANLKLVAEPNEVFVVVFMNSMHEVLAYEPMFKGTINSTTVHARVDPAARFGTERRRGHSFAPAPLGHHGAVKRGPRADPSAEGCVGADRRAGTGSPHRRPGHAVLVRGIRPAVGTASASLITAGASASAFSMGARQAGMRGARDAHCLLGPASGSRLTMALINFQGTRHASIFFQVRVRLANPWPGRCTAGHPWPFSARPPSPPMWWSSPTAATRSRPWVASG
jgi:DNA repair protein RadC